MIRVFALMAAMVLAGSTLAQTTNERWNSSPIPGNLAANNHVPFGATLLPSGDYAVSSTADGPSAKTFFTSINRFTGTPLFFRSGQPYLEVRGTAVGPGGRVIQFGSRSAPGAQAMATVFNAAGSTLATIFDAPLGNNFQTVATAATFDGVGNIYLAGSAVRSAPAFATSWIAKYSSAGVRQWAATPNLANSPNGDRPVGLGIDPSGNLWAAISRNQSSTHVWRLSPLGVTLYGSVWQINGQNTVPVTARMANNRFAIVGNTGNPSRVFVRQYLSSINWVTFDAGSLVAGEQTANTFTVDQFGTLFFGLKVVGGSTQAYLVALARNNVATDVRLLPQVQDLVAIHRQLMGAGRPVFFAGYGFVGGSFRAMAGHTVGTVVHTGTLPGRIPVAAAFNDQNGEAFVASNFTGSSPARMTLTLVDFAPISTFPSFEIFTFTILDGALRPKEIMAANATFTLVTNPDRGTLSLASDGSFTYIPEAVLEPYDTVFNYTLNKPGLAPVSGNCQISVRP